MPLQTALLAAISASFNATSRTVAPGRLSIVTVSGGSVIVAVQIAPAGSGTGGAQLNVSAAAVALSGMVAAGPQGVLAVQVVAALNVSIDSSYAPTIMVACTAGAGFASGMQSFGSIL